MGHRKTLLSIALSTGLIWVAVACNPNQNQGLKVGSLISDGSNISSNGTLGGYTLNLGISNISPTTMQPTSSVYNTYEAVAGTNIRMDLVINGSPVSLVIKPTVYNFANGYYGVQSAYGKAGSIFAMYYYLYWEAKCSSASCETAYINLIIALNGNDAKQIGIKKSMTSNKITALVEVTGDANTLYNKSTDLLIQSLSGSSTM
jgi:hypothetical protein